MFGKLYIFDMTTSEDRDQAGARLRQEPNMTVLGVTSKENWIMQMDVLVSKRLFFNRVLVQTHGAPGKIDIDGKSIYDTTLKSDFVGRNYHALFPTYTLIYFDGCNVAAGSLGDGFLDAVAKIFLKTSGGEVFGWTNYGYAMPSFLPFIGGHTIHFTSGHVKKFYYRAGAIKYTPPADPTPNWSSPFQGKDRPQRGFKI